MEFKEFAHLLMSVIGSSSNTKVFTRTLFETMMAEDGAALLEGKSNEVFKAYYNGKTGITRVAKIVLAHMEDENFVNYLDSFGDATVQSLADIFAPFIEDIDPMSASRKITDLFVEILRNAAGAEKKKSTPKGADETEKTELPEMHPAGELPYSEADRMLLREFDADYDEIMLSMIGEGYAASLIDMTLPVRIKNLYKKWDPKAGTFQDPTLKSHVYALLGELNQLSDGFLGGASGEAPVGQTRSRVRNLYVKLHPDAFPVAYPYEAFIDDWSDGEI